MNENSAVFPELPLPKKFILGLDPATYTTGVGLVDSSGELIDQFDIYGEGEDSLSRSIDIYHKLDQYMSSRKIDTVVLEDTLLNKFVPNLNTCKDLIRLQGLVLACAYKNNIQYFIYTANHWKSVVGIFNGPEGRTRAAQKQRSIQLVKNRYGIDVDDNQSDAICIALSYLVNNEGLNL